MLGIRPFMFGLLVGTCGGLFAAHYHVVRTSDGVVVVPRTERPPLRSTYVDIRAWSQAMWENHPEVTSALVADGRAELMDVKHHEEALPEQTQSNRGSRSRSVAHRPAPSSGTARLLDTKSPARQRLGAVLDEAIAPIVDDDPADLVSEQAEEVLPDDADQAALVRQLEERMGVLTDADAPETADENSSTLRAIPTAGDASEMARDLLKQVIPQGGSLPRSASPLRDIGRDLFSAPAPGSASQQLPRIPVQSALPRSEPF